MFVFVAVSSLTMETPDMSAVMRMLTKIWTVITSLFDGMKRLKDDLLAVVRVVESLKLDVILLNSRDDTKIHNAIDELKVELEKTNQMIVSAHERLDRRKMVKQPSLKRRTSSTSRKRTSSSSPPRPRGSKVLKRRY